MQNECKTKVTYHVLECNFLNDRKGQATKNVSKGIVRIKKGSARKIRGRAMYVIWNCKIE